MRKRALVCLLMLLLAATPVSAIRTRYCEQVYVEDCLNTEYCEFYVNGQPAGSIFIQYDCYGPI